MKFTLKLCWDPTGLCLSYTEDPGADAGEISWEQSKGAESSLVLLPKVLLGIIVSRAALYPFIPQPVPDVLLTQVQHLTLSLVNLMRLPFSLPVWQNKNEEMVETLDKNLILQWELCQSTEVCSWTGSISSLCLWTPNYERSFFHLVCQNKFEKRKETSENCFWDQTPKFYSQELKLPLYLCTYCNIDITESFTTGKEKKIKVERVLSWIPPPQFWQKHPKPEILYIVYLYWILNFTNQFFPQIFLIKASKAPNQNFRLEAVISPWKVLPWVHFTELCANTRFLSVYLLHFL